MQLVEWSSPWHSKGAFVWEQWSAWSGAQGRGHNVFVYSCFCCKRTSGGYLHEEHSVFREPLGNLNFVWDVHIFRGSTQTLTSFIQKRAIQVTKSYEQCSSVVLKNVFKYFAYCAIYQCVCTVRLVQRAVKRAINKLSAFICIFFEYKTNFPMTVFGSDM